jgi:hypothetical protein
MLDFEAGCSGSAAESSEPIVGMVRCEPDRQYRPGDCCLTQPTDRALLEEVDVESAKSEDRFTTHQPAAAQALVASDLGPLAHRVEQGTFNPKVPGSSPGRPTRSFVLFLVTPDISCSVDPRHVFG